MVDTHLIPDVYQFIQEEKLMKNTNNAKSNSNSKLAAAVAATHEPTVEVSSTVEVVEPQQAETTVVNLAQYVRENKPSTESNVDSDKMALLLQSLTTRLVSDGYVFNDDGDVVVDDIIALKKTLIDVGFDVYKDEFLTSFRQGTTADLSAAEFAAAGEDAVNAAIDKIVEHTIERRGNPDKVVVTEIVAGLAAAALVNQSKQGSATTTTTTVEVEATSQPVEEVVIKASDSDAGGKAVTITATTTDGKTVAAKEVVVKTARATYVPNWRQVESDGTFSAVCDPMPGVADYTTAEVKDTIVKAMDAFREFNGKQCNWNTQVVFPDDVDFAGMFEPAEVNELIWGFEEPDLECWDVQSVQVKSYGFDLSY